MKPISKFRPRSLAVGAATAALVLPLAVSQINSPVAHSAVTCDNSSVTGISGNDDSVTATLVSVTVSGVLTEVCELTFEFSGTVGTDDSSTYDWVVPAGVTSADVVIVSGGGGGGAGKLAGNGTKTNNVDDTMAGGGGSGSDLKFKTSLALTASSSARIQVGAGGLGATRQGDNGVVGTRSVLTYANSSESAYPGQRGLGPGGFCPVGGDGAVAGGGAASQGCDTPNVSAFYSGGGGAASQNGGNAGPTAGGAGGGGPSFTGSGLFTGVTRVFGGGGGGGAAAAASGTGGPGANGGGDGGSGKAAGMNGNLAVPGAGGGGGAADNTGWGVGGNGSHGLVIIRFIAPSAPNPPTPPQPAIPPDAPRSVNALAGNGSATVSWEVPASAGSFPISTYKVASQPGGKVCLVTAPATSCVVSGLTNGTSYTFTVEALSGAGWGATSSPSNVVTPSARPDVAATLTLDQGTRTADGRHDRIRTTGSSTGIPVGTKLTPYIKYSGQSSFSGGKATIVVQADGSFTWTRQIRKDKAVTGYVTWTDIESNKVTWAKIR